MKWYNALLTISHLDQAEKPPEGAPLPLHLDLEERIMYLGLVSVQEEFGWERLPALRASVAVGSACVRVQQGNRGERQVAGNARVRHRSLRPSVFEAVAVAIIFDLVPPGFAESIDGMKEGRARGEGQRRRHQGFQRESAGRGYSKRRGNRTTTRHDKWRRLWDTAPARYIHNHVIHCLPAKESEAPHHDFIHYFIISSLIVSETCIRVARSGGKGNVMQSTIGAAPSNVVNVQ